jgi:hypothetical protein
MMKIVNKDIQPLRNQLNRNLHWRVQIKEQQLNSKKFN